MLGVLTVNLSTRCVPGAIPPSTTEHRVAGKSSSRTIQWFCKIRWSTIKSGCARAVRLVPSGKPQRRTAVRASARTIREVKRFVDMTPPFNEERRTAKGEAAVNSVARQRRRRLESQRDFVDRATCGMQVTTIASLSLGQVSGASEARPE